MLLILSQKPRGSHLQGARALQVHRLPSLNSWQPHPQRTQKADQGPAGQAWWEGCARWHPGLLELSLLAPGRAPPCDGPRNHRCTDGGGTAPALQEAALGWTKQPFFSVPCQ